MNRTINREEFYTVAKILTKDAFAFLETERGQDWKNNDVPSYQYRYLHIETRRQIGKSYAAAKLAADYAPTLFVFHSHVWRKEAIERHYIRQYCPTNPDYAFAADDILKPNFLPALGQRIYSHRRRKWPALPPHFKLGIIEDGGAIWSHYNQRKLEEIRDIMLHCCDIVLEFG